MVQSALDCESEWGDYIRRIGSDETFWEFVIVSMFCLTRSRPDWTLSRSYTLFKRKRRPIILAARKSRLPTRTQTSSLGMSTFRLLLVASCQPASLRRGDASETFVHSWGAKNVESRWYALLQTQPQCGGTIAALLGSKPEFRVQCSNGATLSRVWP